METRELTTATRVTIVRRWLFNCNADCSGILDISLHVISPVDYPVRLDCVVKSKPSFWRLKTITDFFRAIYTFIVAFFATMFSMEKSDAYRKGSASGKKWDGGGPGGPGSGPYGGGPRRPPRGMDNVRGIDHSSLPACGSCCG